MKTDSNMLPPFLKTIYVLIVDDKLGTDENKRFLQRFSGLVRGLAMHEKDLEGWTIEVRGVDDPRKALKHIQVRPVDLILVDCDFSRYKGSTQKENSSDELIEIDDYIFNERIKNIGIDLYRHLNNARHFKIKDEEGSLDFMHVLFTDYKKTNIKQFLEDRKWNNKVYGLSKKDVPISNESSFYLLSKNANNTADILVKLLVECKERILNWIDGGNSATADVQYRVLYRFIGHKFAHHDWLPEYLMCIPNGQPKLDDEKNNYLFSIPGWNVYSRGREYKEPSKREKGLFFAFPQNKEVENRSPANEYKLPAITKAAIAFIDYLNKYKPTTDARTIIHNGIYGIYKPTKILDKKDTYKIAAASIEQAANNETIKTYKFGGIEFDSQLWLAATPLTGSTMAGKSEMVIEHYIGKIEALLLLGIGAAVLKTVYPSVESNGEWPEQEMFLKNQSRCYKKSDTLYNTGSTPNEAFPPEMFNRVLNAIKRNESLCKKIIPSLGAHSNDEKTWQELFVGVFKECNNQYPLVEINARHAIREIAVSSGLRGDEYFHPMSADISATLARLTAFYSEFERWVRTVAKIAGKRKLIFKFPYRIDLFVFLNICNVLKKEYKNICGVTLINTFKSPLIHPAIYKKGRKPDGANPKKDFKGFFDVINHPQVSGTALAPIRNYILDALQDNRFIPDGFNLDISASGGINDKEDVIECLTLGAKSVQLGTKLLMKTTATSVQTLNGAAANENPYKKNREITSRIPEVERFVKRRIHFDISKCVRCGSCYSSFYCDAFLNRRFQDKPVKYKDAFYDLAFPLIDEDACVGCGLCEQLCEWGALSLVIKDDNTAGGAKIDNDKKIISYFDKSGLKQVANRKLILASSSPRRSQILTGLGLVFEVQEPNDVNEYMKTTEVHRTIEEVIKVNAKIKAEKVAENNRDAIVIGCDTIIVFNNEIIGKPNTHEKARETLKKLSGQEHSVLSGLAVIDTVTNKELVAYEKTKIKFRNLSDEEIDDYIATGEPLDKAGAYGIQERGELFVEEIEGSFSNVVGLPKELLIRFLHELNKQG